MGIFAIAHILNLHKLTSEAVGEVLLLAFGIQAREIVRNHRVVTGRVAEHFLCQTQTSLSAHFALFFQFSQDGTVISRIHHHGYAFMVFRSRTTADIDVFDSVFKRAVGLSHRGFKGIEVNHDDIDRINAVIGQRFHMSGIGAASQNTRVNLRIERFDTTVEHFRKARVVSHFLNFNAGLGNQFGRTAR